jgi:hypothetical protein
MSYIIQIPEEERKKISKIFAEGNQKKEIKYLVNLLQILQSSRRL